MKTLWLVGLSLLATSLAVSAQTGFYATADLGGTFTQDASFRGGGAENRSFPPTPIIGTVRFDPGLRLGVSGGYHVTDWLGVEAVSGIMSSKIDSVPGDPGDYGATVHNAYFSNIPLMAGIRLEWPHWRISPYAGASAGGSISAMDVDHMYVGNAEVHGVQSSLVFAWQAFGGVRYAINHHMSVGVEYHFFSSQATEWRDHNYFNETDRFRISGLLVNSVSAAFEYKF